METLTGLKFSVLDISHLTLLIRSELIVDTRLYTALNLTLYVKMLKLKSPILPHSCKCMRGSALQKVKPLFHVVFLNCIVQFSIFSF